MGDQLTTSAAALRMFFTDDTYLVGGDEQLAVTAHPASASSTPSASLPAIEPVPNIVAETVLDPMVETAVNPVAELSPAADFKYLGKNQKNVLILVKDDQNDVSTERGRELLGNIVKALHLTANDFALLNYYSYQQQQFPVLTGFFASKLVMAFGVTPVELGLTDHLANSIVMEGPIQVVFSQNLDLLADNQSEKKALWGSMKKIQL